MKKQLQAVLILNSQVSDPENVYAGVFVSRNADVTFYDINLELK